MRSKFKLLLKELNIEKKKHRHLSIKFVYNWGNGVADYVLKGKQKKKK